MTTFKGKPRAGMSIGQLHSMMERGVKLSEEGTKAVFDALEDTSPPNSKMIEAAVQYKKSILNDDED